MSSSFNLRTHKLLGNKEIAIILLIMLVNQLAQSLQLIQQQQQQQQQEDSKNQYNLKIHRIKQSRETYRKRIFLTSMEVITIHLLQLLGVIKSSPQLQQI